jgi:hypothetical protein
MYWFILVLMREGRGIPARTSLRETSVIYLIQLFDISSRLRPEQYNIGLTLQGLNFAEIAIKLLLLQCLQIFVATALYSDLIWLSLTSVFIVNCPS